MAALAVRRGAGERTVTRVLRDAVHAHPHQAAVRFEDADYTHTELWSRARRAARALRDAGVRQGDAVLVMQENTIQFVDAWLGLALLGAVQVPVNTEYRGQILQHQVANSGARLMLLERQFVERVDAGGGLRLLVVEEDWAQAFTAATELPESDLPEVAEQDLVAIMYTSGTTGPSKGVRVTHAHAYMYANLAAQALELTADDVYYAPLPLFHIAGQWALVYACLQMGGAAVVRRRFSAGEFWSVVRETGVTVSFLLGAMANF